MLERLALAKGKSEDRAIREESSTVDLVRTLTVRTCHAAAAR